MAAESVLSIRLLTGDFPEVRYAARGTGRGAGSDQAHLPALTDCVQRRVSYTKEEIQMGRCQPTQAAG